MKEEHKPPHTRIQMLSSYGTLLMVVIITHQNPNVVSNPNVIYKSKCYIQIQMLYTNPNVVHKSKCCTQIQMLYTNPNAVHKSKCCTQI